MEWKGKEGTDGKGWMDGKVRLLYHTIPYYPTKTGIYSRSSLYRVCVCAYVSGSKVK